MPDDLNIQPAEGQPDLGEEGTAQEPKKYTIPGLEGEFTAEQITSWKTDSDNKQDWRRALNDKGVELNEVKRELDNKAQSLSEIERRLNELDTRVSQPQQPTRDWRTIEDPVERQSVFLEEFARKADERFDKTEARIQQFEQKLTARERAERERAEMQKWQNVADTAIDQVLPADLPEETEPKIRKAIQGYMGMELSEIDKRNWNSEAFARAARNAYEAIDAFGTSKVEKIVKSKKKGAEAKTVTSGQAAAPEAKNKFNAKMSKAERMEMMRKDPNFTGNW